MNPVNLDEKTQNWHTDATLPPTLRARLSEAAPQKKRRRPSVALRYGLAACVGVSLGLGFVAMRNRPVSVASQNILPTNTVTEKAFMEVYQNLRCVTGSSQVRYEVILFTDFECPSCKLAMPKVLKLTNVKLAICHFPLVSIHPDAFRLAWILEIAIKQRLFYFMTQTLEHDPNGLKVLGDKELRERLQLGVSQFEEEKAVAIKRVQEQINQAREHGISETPTFWVRQVKTGSVRTAVGYKQLEALLAVQ